MLLFQKKFIEQIKRGEKTQTIRLWKHCRMKPGQRSYIPGIGYIAVTNVERVELDQLTDADALLDGFQTADALRAELCTLYDADILAQRKSQTGKEWKLRRCPIQGQDAPARQARHTRSPASL